MEWSASYTIGVEAIDAQHKRLVHMITRLQTALACGDADLEVANALRFLVDYAREHFGDEERLMQDIGFVELDQHRERHRGFVEQVVHLLTDVKKGKKVDPYALVDYLADWLARHIRHEDKKIGRWLEDPARSEFLRGQQS